MNYLIILLSLFSSVTWAETVPMNMTHTSMQSIQQRANLVADVTVGHPLTDKVVFIMGDANTVQRTSMLHTATLTAIKKTQHLPERFMPEVGDTIVISQWKDLASGQTYDGTPVLQEGFEYRVYLNYSHGRTDKDIPIYTITGINGGLFSKEGTLIYRDDMNTSIVK